MQKQNKTQEKISLTKQSSLPYKTWPVFLLAFIRLFYVSIFERALSNYLLWDIGIRESVLGFISSAGAITYIFAPMLGQVITKKFLGTRNALILTSILTPLLTGLQIIYPVPWFLITCRILLGLTLGFFWPNCLNLLSKWQKVSSIEKSKKNFALFNLSWNSGFISGLLVGFLWSFTLGDFSPMLISWLLSFLLIPVSFFIKKDKKPDSSKEIIIYQSEDPLSHLDIKEDLVINGNTPMIVYPVLFSWISIMFLTISKSIFIFGYQFLVDSLLSEEFSYLTYLVQCGIQFMQLVGLTWINSMKIYSRKIASLISIITVSLIALTIVLVGDIWYISIISAITGLFLGLIHGVGMKIMLEYGTAENTTKYSTINEILIGIGFGLTPVIAGYTVEVYLYGIHWFLTILGPIILIFLVFLSRNINRKEIQ
ncbi:MAG: MFS transporter [Promethearchaeota archaeon]|nr:MAG: MFS transporter [Candidatus Lokiarchaeota archaeon]